MLFKDSLRFAHGSLKRGDRCLYRSMPCIYLGSFRKAGDTGFRHLLVTDNPVIDTVLECSDSSKITCKVQARKVADNQLELV